MKRLYILLAAALFLVAASTSTAFAADTFEVSLTSSPSSVLPGGVTPGSAVAYTITVVYQATDGVPSTATTVTDVVPASVTLNNTSLQASVNGQPLTLFSTDPAQLNTGLTIPGSLNPGDVLTLTFTGTANAALGTVITSSASVQSATVPAAVSSSPCSISVDAGAFIVSQANPPAIVPATAGPGSTVTYTINAQYVSSTASQAANTTISDNLPAELTAVGGSLVVKVNGVVVNGVSSDPGSLAGAGLNINTPLNPLDNVQVSFHATVNSGVTGGVVVTDTASVHADATVPESALSSFTVAGDRLAIAKGNSPTTVFAGGVLSYSVTVLYTSPTNNPAPNMVLTDVLPGGVAGVPGTLAVTVGGVGVTAKNVGLTATTNPADLAQGVNIGTVTPTGGVATIVLTFNATVNAAAGTLITNSATASSDNLPTGVSNVSQATVANAGIFTLSKSCNQSAAASGSTVQYTLASVYGGVVTAQDATLFDIIPGQMTAVPGTLVVLVNGLPPGTVTTDPNELNTGDGVDIGPVNPGDTITAQFSAIINAGTPDGTIVTNSASIEADGIFPTTTLCSLTVLGSDSFTMTKATDITDPVPGGPLNYSITIEYSSPGGHTDSNVVITDTIPGQITVNPTSLQVSVDGVPVVVNNSAGQPTVNPNDLVTGVTIPTLTPVNASATIVITFASTVQQVGGGTSITNTASVQSTNVPVPVKASNTVTTVAPDAFTIMKTNTPTNPVVSPIPSVLTYTLTIVYASGQGNPASDVVVTDPLPAQVTQVAGSMIVTVNGVVITPQNSGGNPTTDPVDLAQGIQIGDVPLVNGAGTVVVTFKATVFATTAVGTVISNTGSVTSENVPNGPQATSTATVVNGGGVMVTKKVDVGAGGPGYAAIGDVLTYTIVVQNLSGADQQGITLVDSLPNGIGSPGNVNVSVGQPGGLEFVVGSINGPYNANTGQLLNPAVSYRSTTSGAYNYSLNPVTPPADPRYPGLEVDPNVGGIQWNFGTVPAGADYTLQFQVRSIPPMPAALTSVQFTNTATASQLGTVTSSSTSPTVTILTQPSVSVSASKKLILPGDTFTYRVVVYNPTTIPVQMNLGQALPAGVSEIPGTMTSTSTALGGPTPVGVDSTVMASLQAGTYQVKLDPSAYFELDFEVESPSAGANAAVGADLNSSVVINSVQDQNNPAVVTFLGGGASCDVIVGAVVITKVADRAFAYSPASTGALSPPGDVIQYTISVSNPTDTNVFYDGQATSTPVGIMDTLDPNESYVVGSTSGPADTFFSTTTAGAFVPYIPEAALNPYGTDASVRRVYYSFRSLPAHSSSLPFSLLARVDAGLAAASVVTNTAQFQGTVGDPSAPHPAGPPWTAAYISAPMTATVTISTIQFDKTVDKALVVVGDQLTYTLTLSDPAAAVIDPQDPHVVFTGTDTFTVDGVPGTAANYNSLSGAGYNLPAGTTPHVLKYSVHVVPGAAIGTVIQNVATDTTQNPQVSSTVTSTTVGELNVSLAVDQSIAPPGGTLNYTITVSNPTDSFVKADVFGVIPTGTGYVIGSATLGLADQIIDFTGFSAGTYGSVVDTSIVQVQWVFSSIPPHSGPFTLHYAVQIDQAAASGTMVTTSDPFDWTSALFPTAPAPSDNSNTVSTMVSFIEFGEKADKSVILPGDTIDYTLTYVNLDPTPSDAAPNPLPTVMAVLSSGQTYVTGTLSVDGVPQPGAPETAIFNGGLALPAASNAAPGSQTHTITFSVTTDPTALVGTQFTAFGEFTLSPQDPVYGTLATLVSGTSTVTVGALEIAKTVQAVTPATTPPSVQYTFTVSNPTDTALSTVAGEGGAYLIDPLDANLNAATVNLTQLPSNVTGVLGRMSSATPALGSMTSFDPTGTAPSPAIEFHITSLPAHSPAITITFTISYVGAGVTAYNSGWIQPAYWNGTTQTLGDPTFSNVVGSSSSLANLDLTKSSNPASGSTVYTGQKIDFTLNAQFASGIVKPMGTTSYSFVLWDAIPAGTSFVVGSNAYLGKSTLQADNGNGALGPGEFTSVPAEFSDDNGMTWTYTPTANGSGVDPAVTDIRWEVTVSNIDPATLNAPTGAISVNGGSPDASTFSVLVNTSDAIGTVIPNTLLLSTPVAPLLTAAPGIPANTFVPSNEVSLTVSTDSLVKSVSTNVASPGDNLIYSIAYADQSQNPQQLFLTDQIPADTSYVVGSGTPTTGLSFWDGNTWTYTPVANSSGLDPNVIGIRWDMKQLVGPGVVSFAVRVNASLGETSAADDEVISNSAALVAAGASLSSASIQSNTVQTTIDSLNLVKSVDTTAALPGGLIHYTLQYSNGLSDVLSTCTILDAIPANSAYVVGSAYGLNIQFLNSTYQVITPNATGPNGTDPNVAWILWTLGDLTPAGAGTVGYAVAVSTTAASGALITNSAILATKTTGIQPHLSNTVTTGVWPLQVVKSVSPAVVAPGGDMTYTLTYSSTAAVTNVSIVDPIPAGTAYLTDSALPSGGVTPDLSTDGGVTWTPAPQGAVGAADSTVTTVRWQLGSVAAGASGSLQFQVQVSAAAAPIGVVSNTGSQTGTVGTFTPTSPIPTNTATTLLSLLNITKSVNLPYATPGETLQYSMAVTDLSTTTAVSSTIVLDRLPDNVLYVVGSASPVLTGPPAAPEFSQDGVNWGYTPVADALGVDDTPNLYIRWQLGTIPAYSAPVALGFQARIDDPNDPAGSADLADGTSIVNVAHVNGQGQPDVVSNLAVTIISHLEIRKQVDRASAVAGDTLTYSLTFANDESVAYPGVFIEDFIPANTQFVPGSIVCPNDLVNGSTTAHGNVVQYSPDFGTTWSTVVPATVTAIRVLLDADPVTLNQDPFQAGETGSLSFQVTVTGSISTTPPTPPFGTVITNVAYLSSVFGPPSTTLSLPSNPAITTIWPLQLVKSVDKPTTQLGVGAPANSNLLTYTIVASDLDPATDLTAVQVVDPIPGGTEFVVGSVTPVSAPPGVTVDYSIDGGRMYGYTPVANANGLDANVTDVRWTWASLVHGTPGQTATFQVLITASLSTGVCIPNTASGTAIWSTGLPTQTTIGPALSNTVETCIETGVMVKSVNLPDAAPGNELQYTITLNTGAAGSGGSTAPLTNLIITDSTPDGGANFTTTYVVGSATPVVYGAGGAQVSPQFNYPTYAGAPWTYVPVAVNGSDGTDPHTGMQIRWVFPNVPLGTVITVTYRVRISDASFPLVPVNTAYPADGQVIPNQAVAAAANGFSATSNTVTTTVTHLIMLKSVDKVSAVQGELLNYSLQFENEQPVGNDLPNAYIQDQIPGQNLVPQDTAFVVGSVQIPANVLPAGTVSPNANLVQYSKDGIDWTYVPVADARGTDVNVQFIRILLDVIDPALTPPTQANFVVGETGSATFQVRVGGDITASPPVLIPPFDTVISNTASLNSPAGTVPPTISIPSNPAVTTLWPLRLTKTVDRGTTVMPPLGPVGSNILTYTIGAENLAPDTNLAALSILTDVRIVDAIPGNTQFIVGSAPAVANCVIDYSIDGGVTYGNYTPVANAQGVDPNVTDIRFTFSEIDPGTSGSTVSFQVEILSTVVVGVTIANSATATGLYQQYGVAPPPVAVGPVQSNTVTTTITDVYFNKSSSVSTYVRPGELFVYTIPIQNYDVTQPMVNPTVTDLVATGLAVGGEVIQTGTATAAPPTPTGFSGQPGDGQVALGWVGTSSAASYNLYRSTNAAGPFTQLVTGIGLTSYLDTSLTDNTTYYYKVTAVNSFGESAQSAAIAFTPKAGLAAPASFPSNSVNFVLPTIPAYNAANPGNSLVQVLITVLVPLSAVVGDQYDNVANLSYTDANGVRQSLQSNLVINIVSAAGSGIAATDTNQFHVDSSHTGLIPVQGFTPLCPQSVFNASSQGTVSFVASPVVITNAPVNTNGTTGAGTVIALQANVIEYIGDTGGNFWALQADTSNFPPNVLWTQNYGLPINSTAAVQVGNYGATPVVDKTGTITSLSYLRTNQWFVVFGTGGIDANGGQTTGSVECTDAVTGQVLWEYDLTAPVLGPVMILQNVSAHLLFQNPNSAYVSPLPYTTTISVVYVGCADGNMYAFNLSGAQVGNTGTVAPQLLWVKPALGINLGAPAGVGTAAIAYTEQASSVGATTLYTDYLHAVTTDATVDATGFPLDAVGNHANPFAIDAQGNSTPDFPVPSDYWSIPASNNRVQLSPVGTPSYAQMTQTPMVDNSDTVNGPVIHVTDQNRLLAINGTTGQPILVGGIPVVFTASAIAAIPSTPALAQISNPSTAGSAAVTYVYITTINYATQGSSPTYNNALYALTFSRTQGYQLAWPNAVNGNPVNLDSVYPPAKLPQTTIPLMIASPVTATTSGTSGEVYVATQTGVATGSMTGRVVSFDAYYGAANGPLGGILPFELSYLIDDANENESATPAMAIVPGADRPWLFGATLGGSLFVLGCEPAFADSGGGATGGGSGGPGGSGLGVIGTGPPGVLVQKTMVDTTAQTTTIPRTGTDLEVGDELTYTITAFSAGNTVGASLVGTGSGGVGGIGGSSGPLSSLAGCACALLGTVDTGVGGGGGGSGTGVPAGPPSGWPMNEQPLLGLVVVENIPTGTTYQNGTASAVHVYDYLDYGNAPDGPSRWVIPQVIVVGAQVVQVVWDFRSSVDDYGYPGGAVSAPGGMSNQFTLNVSVDNPAVTVQGNPGVTVSTFPPLLPNGQPNPCFTDLGGKAVDYGESLYASATGFNVDMSGIHPIQDIVSVYASNATEPINSAAATVADPYAPQTPGQPLGGLTALPPPAPALPPLNPAMATFPAGGIYGGALTPGAIAPYAAIPYYPLGKAAPNWPNGRPDNPTNTVSNNPAIDPTTWDSNFLNAGPIASAVIPGFLNGQPAPQGYATPPAIVDTNPNNLTVKFKIMRYTAAQPAFVPVSITEAPGANPNANGLKYQLVWEPGEQRSVVGSSGYLVEGKLTKGNGGAWTATPTNGAGASIPVYTLSTRNPNGGAGGLMGRLAVSMGGNGALSPSGSVGNGLGYSVEVWAQAGANSAGAANSGYLERSVLFGVNNPIDVISGNGIPAANVLNGVEDPQQNGNLPELPNGGGVGTVLDVGTSSHGQTSAQSSYTVWDTSHLAKLKPVAGATTPAPFAKYSTLQVRVVRPNRVVPQPTATHFDAQGNPVAFHYNGQGNAVFDFFNPNPNVFPRPWDTNLGLVEDNLQNPLSVAAPGLPYNTARLRTHDFSDGFGDMLKNGISTNQYRWHSDPANPMYIYDLNTTDTVLAGGHFETYAALTRAPLNLGVTAAKQLFDQDYPPIPGQDETWSLGTGNNPAFSLVALSNASLTQPGGCNSPTVTPVPSYGTFSVNVPKYQPDDALTPLGHNPGQNQNTVANHWYGYLGRTYVMLDVYGDGNLHVFDPINASPSTFNYTVAYPAPGGQTQARVKPPNKDSTYEDPYRVLDVATEVAADINFGYAQQAINLNQFPHGSSDLAQQVAEQGSNPPSPIPNTAWSYFDVVNHGNVNLVAVAPWHWDNGNQRYGLIGKVFNSTRTFYSDNLFGVSVGAAPVDPHVYEPRTDIWWSTTPRDQLPTTYGGNSPLGNVGKLPKAQAGSSFDTSLSSVNGSTALFQPWLGVDIPIGQPVGSYSNSNIRLREPDPNPQTGANGQLIAPDPISNPNLQGAAVLDGLGVENPVFSKNALTLTVRVEESAPPTFQEIPALFNQKGWSATNTINDIVGNDDSPAPVVQSVGAQAGVTTIQTNLFMYFVSNRGGNTVGFVPSVYSTALAVPYDVNTGTGASTFNPGFAQVTVFPQPQAIPGIVNPLSIGVTASSPTAPPQNLGGEAMYGPSRLAYGTPDGVISEIALAQTGTPASNPLPLSGPGSMLQGARPIDTWMNNLPAAGQLRGAVGYGVTAGRLFLAFLPELVQPNQGAGQYGAPIILPTPTSVANPRDPSAMLITGGAGKDTLGIAFSGASTADQKLSIYANRFYPAPQTYNGVAYNVPNSAAPVSWGRVGLSVDMRNANPTDTRAGETLLPDPTSTVYRSRNIQWLMGSNPVVPATPPAAGYPAYTPGTTTFADWPQIILYDPTTNQPANMANVAAGTMTTILGANPVLTPPLNTANQWFYDPVSKIWLLQNTAARTLVLSLDSNAGVVRFAAPMPVLSANPQQTLLVRADYTPGALRLTQGSASDISPVMLMDDTPNSLAHPTRQAGGPVVWNTVSRHTLWLLWRRTTVQSGKPPAATLFYTAYRLQVNLPVQLLNDPNTGVPDVTVYQANPNGSEGNVLANNLYGIDVPNNRLWFDGSVEGTDIVVDVNTQTAASHFTFATTVGWSSAKTETQLPIQGIVNEGQASAAIETVQIPLFDPFYDLPLDQTGTATFANTPVLTYNYPRIWVFWSSTRNGATSGTGVAPNTDVFYETVVPKL